MEARPLVLRSFYAIATAFLVIAALYLAKDFFIPLALAGLFAFMLSPLVRKLCRLGIPQVGSVVLVTVLTFSLLGVLIWLLGRELGSLANELPAYKKNIQERIESVQKMGEGGLIAKLRKFGADLSNSALNSTKSGTSSPDAPTQANGSQTPAPAPPSPDSKVSNALNTVLTGLANGLGTAAVVILFVIFILLRQEDLGQRVVRLAGFSRLTTTTRALDEVGGRISKYLLMQGTVNGIYGILLALGLWMIGLPYVILWGALAALFRFIPYIGPWIVAVLPSALSLVVFDGWTQPLMVIGLIVILELGTNMFLEPVLYGQSVGVNDLSLLVAIAFWTWLWDGVGLVLATPLTVCIVVFCKYIPSAEWVDILMGDKPQPQPHLTLYQQLLNGDRELAEATVEDAITKDGEQSTLDTIIIPALALTRREEALGKIDREEQESIYSGFEMALGTLGEQRLALRRKEESIKNKEAKAAAKKKPDKEESSTESASEEEREEIATIVEQAEVIKRPPMVIYARALHGEADALALRFLGETLPPFMKLEVSAEPHLIGELVQEMERMKPALICISAIPPHAQVAASTLCRRLHSRLPNLKILVCRWSLHGEKSDDRWLRESGANWVASSLTEAREIMERYAETGV